MDTIYSSASSAPKSAIKIIRISGPESKNISSIFFFKPTKPRLATLRSLLDSSQNIIDKAIIIFFPGPSTSTGEDIIEIHFHGSIIIERKILNVLANQKKFRLAEPGEYTKRAFLNGLLDLTQAEGLNDLINSETNSQFNLAMSQFQGKLYEKITSWRGEIIFLLSKLEALIDFSDEELSNDVEKIFFNRLKFLINDLKISIESKPYAERIISGFVVTLIGKTNVGKSSLINFLTKRNYSIVTNEPGTTRDILEVSLDLKGYPVIFNDTAGIRYTKSLVEQIGIKKALERAESSDLILILSDNDKFDFPELSSKAKKILVHTKSDLGKLDRKDIHEISVKDGVGILELIDKMVTHFHSLKPKENVLLTKQRHVQAVNKTLEALLRISNVDLNLYPELVAEELRVAATAIGSITNVVDVDEILDDIFSSFCIGK